MMKSWNSYCRTHKLSLVRARRTADASPDSRAARSNHARFTKGSSYSRDPGLDLTSRCSVLIYGYSELQEPFLQTSNRAAIQFVAGVLASVQSLEVRRQCQSFVHQKNDSLVVCKKRSADFD